MIEPRPNTRNQNIRGWIAVACGALFYMYQFMIRVSPNVMNGVLLTNFSIDSAGLGLMVGVYYWSYAAVQIPLGITMDRLGPRLFMCGAAFLCSIACFIFGNTTNPIIGGMARFLMGMGAACGFIGTVKLGTIWLDPKQVAKVTGATILMGTTGACLGGAPLELLLNKVGFSMTMQLLGLIGIGVSILIYFFVSNHPSIDHHEELPDLYRNAHPLTHVLLIVKTPQAWGLAVYGMLMYLPITTLGVAWGVPFVERLAGVSELVAASVISTMFLGAALGSPMWAFFSDYIKSRRIPMIMGSAITAAVWFVIFTAKLPLYVLYILFFVGGFAYPAKCLTFASICEIMPLKMSGVSVAFVNMIVMATGIIFHPLIGRMINAHWNGAMLNNIPYYTVEDYRFALIIIPALLILSGVISFFMKETHPDHAMPKEYGPVIDTDVL
jgi:sugar phosphate permease